MSAPIPGYNERAWAIDVISEINSYSAARSRAIVRAGGEYTLSGQSGSLFPDVILFGDASGAVVQQGWELKMPDTAVNDQLLLNNAEQKARRLSLNSLVVWNATEAVLYMRDANDLFVHFKSWPGTGIKRRDEVATNREAWVSLLHQMIDDLNDLMDYGQISGSRPEAAISDALFVDYLNHYVPTLSQALHVASQTDADFDAEVKLWWFENKIEHPGSTQFQSLARTNIINWINRILFAHYLKRFNSAAGAVESIVIGTSVPAALEIFENISASCDFLNIFRATLGQQYLDPATWDGLIDLNGFLKDFKLDSISQTSFHQIIDGALNNSRRKLSGQFSTPKPLADLLVRLTVKDRTKPVMDPCCGTGTIARAAYDLKRSVGIGASAALAGTWASDKFAVPLQLCSISLSDPMAMGEVVQVFRHDAFELTTGQDVAFTDPSTGKEFVRELPLLHAVVSNLPFVRFEDSETLNPSLGRIKDTVVNDCSGKIALDGRADLYAYLVLKLRDLIEDYGRLGVICSNSWLAAEWGRDFRKILASCFKIRQIVISGEGRWFDNADVITTLLILEKREGSPDDEERISFVATTERIEHWETASQGVDTLAAPILAGGGAVGKFTQQKYTQPEIHLLEAVGIGWNALFADLSWVAAVANKLIPLSDLFDIKRGERRGWDPMFYPQSGHGIERQYIRSVVKSARQIPALMARANDEAFCCSDSIATLKATGMKGALAWISKFEHSVNGTNKPLPKVLARTGCEWYEMSPSTLADLVVSMNPDRRLCVHRLAQRSFVNQRLIRFTSHPATSVNIELCHALMNSAVGMFLIEANGFGRGLGALDLNATKLSQNMRILDPSIISASQQHLILTAFVPLTRRDVLDLVSELQASDRINFDQVVFQAFNIGSLQKTVYESLLQLFHIRQTAKT